jgi:hypothetical protein
LNERERLEERLRGGGRGSLFPEKLKPLTKHSIFQASPWILYWVHGEKHRLSKNKTPTDQGGGKLGINPP